MNTHKNSSFSLRKLLAVDDVPDNLFLVQAILNEQNGYEVACAENGRAALESIESSPPELILLDIMMPDMTGYEVTRKVRQNPKTSDIPILLITAHNDITQKRALEAGADGFIRKPFDIDYLVTQVEETLQKKPAACH
ncbi:MAG: response regulator [Cyanobacteria bacterium P01_D01_bin.36]